LLADTSTSTEALAPVSDASTSTEPDALAVAPAAEADRAADLENFSREACVSDLATAAGGVDGLALLAWGSVGSLNSGRSRFRVGLHFFSQNCLVMVFFSMLQFCRTAGLKPASSSSSDCQEENLQMKNYFGNA
jgi:hypothetical protein